MTQYFKGDARELQFINSAKPILDQRSLQKDIFFDEAYACFLLGDVLHNTKKAPLTSAMSIEIFRESFPEIFDAFIVAGTLESYLTVFRKIFGDTVDVTFTVPGPGKLNIDIIAEGVILSDFAYREVIEGAYYLDEVIDDEGDTIVFQGIKGFESQYELEQMLFEMVPQGIYTEISLTLGV